MKKSVQHLVERFAPAHYAIALDISQRTERVFNGTVTITGELLQPAQAISLHAKELVFSNITINDQPATWRNAPDDELVITAEQPLKAGSYTITIAYSGTITEPMHGLYPCRFTLEGEPHELLMTQLESHSAREVFPCIDEPAAKATFKLTLTTEPDITVLSNTPVVSQHTQNNALVTQFERTPVMSAYLLAFVAGKLQYRETTSQSGVKIRAYATPDKNHQLGFALDIASKALDFYNEYFDTPFPLPKCDLVACPDFSAGAMENWGLITFREAALLVDEHDTPADARQYIATVITHELAHQWFGNLVTMKWWDDLWLNESFANWMEYYALVPFFPEWKLWEQTGATEKLSALTRDGLAKVQAVRQPVHHPDEIGTLFDPAIVYAKGGSLIHMLNDYIGADTFRDGLRIYMKRHAYGNTTMHDLWAALSEASGHDIEAFMAPWVTQPGHPVVTARITNGKAHISQRRFYASPAHAPQNDSTVWPVPLLAPTLQNADILASANGEYTLEPAPFHIINHGATGFYHTKYDEANLKNIAQAISKGDVIALDRQRLLLDSTALNRSGDTPTVHTLTLLNHYKNESDYAVWLAISSALSVARLLINDDPQHKPHLQKFVASISAQQFARLGWAAKKDESHFDTLLRPDIIANMAYAEHPDVIARCLQLFDDAKKPEDIPSEIRSIVYSVAVRERGKAVVDTLITWYETASADERINICAGITSMRDAKLAEATLPLITSPLVKLQDVMYWFIYFIRNHYTRTATWQWMEHHWQWIKTNFGGDINDYASFPKYAASALSTRQELAMYKAFFEPKLTETGIHRTITLGIEDIETRALWRERDLADVAAFLQEATANS